MGMAIFLHTPIEKQQSTMVQCVPKQSYIYRFLGGIDIFRLQHYIFHANKLENLFFQKTHALII